MNNGIHVVVQCAIYAGAGWQKYMVGFSEKDFGRVDMDKFSEETPSLGPALVEVVKHAIHRARRGLE